MTSRRDRSVLIGAAILLAAFLGLACASRLGSALPGWDEQVADAFVAWRSAGWSRAFWLFTVLADDSLMAPLAAGLVVLVGAWGRRTRAAVFAGGLILSWAATHVTKAAVGRARPPDAPALIELPASHSMPSGHALIIVVFCGLLVYALFRSEAVRGAVARSALVLVATMVVVGVGASRVYLGVHWLSDVLAGWCLGGAILLLILYVATRWKRYGPPRAARDSAPWGTKSTRVVLVAVVVAIVVAAAALSVWADPLLS